MSSDLFIFYSRKDDLLGFVSALHDELEADYAALTGRSDAPVAASGGLRSIIDR